MYGDRKLSLLRSSGVIKHPFPPVAGMLIWQHKQLSQEAMITDPLAIRNYQKITDSLVDMWHKGYTRDELRLFIDGFVAALRVNNSLDVTLIHKLEAEAVKFLYEPANFQDPFVPEPQPELNV